MDSDKIDWDLEERDRFMDYNDREEVEPATEIIVASNE